MKDSGVVWIGDIPADWEVGRNKVHFKCSKEIVGADSSRTQLLSLSTNGIKCKDFDNLSGKVPESFDTYQLVHPNNLVMCLFDLDCSAVFSGISEYEGMISPAYKVIECKDTINPIYADYWFKYIFDGRKFKHYSKNLRYTLTYDEFCDLPILLPGIQEQNNIANYLSTVCNQIDVAKERTQSSIEDYKKLKQSVITRAVTKGVRGERPMKDSGVEWIGKIPTDWDIIKFKYVAKVEQNLVNPEDYPDYPQVSPDNIEKGTGRLISYKKVSESGVISGNNLFNKGQIIYSKIRPGLNKLTLAAFDGLCSADMYPISTRQYSPWLMYGMLSESFVKQVDLVTRDRVKMPKINQNELGNILLAVPSCGEQYEIAVWLENYCAKFDSLIDDKMKLLSELESYKKSLVYEYVTGKKEVPLCQ
jgi:type I restriction enzyme S subunit